VDRLTPAQRSANMRAVRSNNTAPELLARRAAHSIGLRFRLHQRDLPGSPDLVFPRYRTVVFVHGCFWHGHPNCPRASLPKSNAVFWHEKVGRNRQRDRRARAALKKLGWKVVILWQCQIKTQDAAIEKLSSALQVKAPTRKSPRRAKTSRPKRRAKGHAETHQEG
jgi:DNA mismatch endonuclease (patch repair protein)